MRRPPGRPRASKDRATAPRPPITFRAGKHEITIWDEAGRWTAAVNGTRLASWFTTQVDAWTAGVTEADRIDRTGDA